MKKSKKEILKISKRLFQESFTDQKLDTTRIRTNINLIKKNYKTRTLEVLRVYFHLLKTYLAKKTLVIEAADTLPTNDIKQIQNYFEKRTGGSLGIKFQQNPLLIGGLKVTVGDTLWDFSVKEKISEMKEVLSGGYH
jgi:F0F1-type ATP synthase delta subunit